MPVSLLRLLCTPLLVGTLGMPAFAQYPAEQAFLGSPAMEEFEGRLRTNGLLARLQWAVVECKPGVMLVHKPDKGGEDFVNQVAVRYAGHVRQLSELLEERYFKDLPRNRGDFGYSLFVAQNQRIFANLRRTAERPSRDVRAAITYDDWGLVIAYDRGLGSARPPAFERRPVLRELVREAFRQRADYKAMSDWPLENWLVEGLASWHTYHEGEDPKELLEPTLNPQAKAWLEGLAEEPKELDAFLLPLDDLRQATDERQLTARVEARTAAAGLEKPGVSDMAKVNEHLPELYVAYLVQVNPSALQGIVKELLAGTSDGGVLDRTLGGSAEERYANFRAWIEATLTGKSIAAVQTETPGADGYRSPKVAVLPESTQDWLTLALGLAAEGQYAKAENLLEAAEGEQGVETTELATWRGHIAALRGSRDGLLQALVGSKKKLRLPLDGKKITVGVEAIEEGTVLFAKNRNGLEKMQVDELPPASLGVALGRDADKYGPSWGTTFARWLSGDERWDRSVDEDDAEEMAMVEILKATNEALQGGQVAQALDSLAREEPDSKEGAARIHEQLAQLMRDHASHPLIKARTEHLTDLGARALNTIYAAKGLSGRMAGKVADLPDGRLQVTYDFSSPEELGDWVAVKSYLPKRRTEKFEVPLSEEESTWEVKAGNLQGVGQGCFRHALRWKAPLTLRFEILYGRPEKGQGELGTILTAICDNGAGSYVGTADIHDLETVIKEQGLMLIEAEREDRSVRSAKAYKLAMIHDGEDTVTLERNGEPLRTISAAGLKEGNVVFWLHSQMMMAVRKVQIEGYLDSSVEEDPNQGPWVDEQLKEMGLYR